MTIRISIGVAALALGAALVSVPALAQQTTPYYGRALNDGGIVPSPAGPAAKVLYNSVAPAAPHYGKALDDGGLVEPPSAAQMAVNRSVEAALAKQKPSAPHYGKALDDGGLVD